MRNRMYYKPTLLAVLALSTLAAVVMFMNMAQRPSLAQQPVAARNGARNQPGVEKIFSDSRRSLRELTKARKDQSLIAYERQKPPMYSTLKELVSYSTAVVVAVAQQNSSHLSADETSVTIDYEVSVKDVIKGDLWPGGTARVSLPGGSVNLSGGGSIEVRTPWFRKMDEGKTYLLFLTEEGSKNGAFLTTGGAQGLFEVTADGNLRTNSGQKNDPVWKYHGRSVQSLLKEIRETTGKK